MQSESKNTPIQKNKPYRKRVFAWIKKQRFRFEMCLFILLVIVILCWDRIFITIQSGEMGVHFRRFGGTVLDKPPMGEGLHVVFPLDTIHIYNIRQQEHQHKFDVLAKDGLHIEIEISIRYHPSREKTDLNYLHVLLGPNYLQTVVVPEIESALRFIVGKYDPSELYQAEFGMLDAALNESLMQLSENYVILDDLLITRITLPSFVQKAIEDKLTEFHNAEKYQYLLIQAEEEAKRKVILATGIRDFQDIVSEGISTELLRWRGIEATLELAKSPNAKVVVIGGAKDGLPLILNTGEMQSASTPMLYSSTETIETGLYRSPNSIRNSTETTSLIPGSSFGINKVGSMLSRPFDP
jgi:prohibitin 1